MAEVVSMAYDGWLFILKWPVLMKWAVLMKSELFCELFWWEMSCFYEKWPKEWWKIEICIVCKAKTMRQTNQKKKLLEMGGGDT